MDKDHSMKNADEHPRTSNTTWLEKKSQEGKFSKPLTGFNKIEFGKHFYAPVSAANDCIQYILIFLF